MSFIKKYAEAVKSSDAGVLDDIKGFAEWHVGHRNVPFDPRNVSDVDLRTFLLHLRINGESRKVLQKTTASLKDFYGWVHREGMISGEELARLQFDKHSLDAAEIRVREDMLDGDTVQQELSRLRTLNRITELLNQAVDLRSAIDTTLENVVKLLGLDSAWVSLWKGSARFLKAETDEYSHDFTMGGCCNLPPGLQRDNCMFLRRPPDCHCQKLLREGNLVHAVNVVECSRLREAELASRDTGGLNYHATVPLITSQRAHGVMNVATKDWELFTGSDLKLLSMVGCQIANAIERVGIYEESRRKQNLMTAELELARSVQASCMPSKLPEIPGFSLASEWRAAREVAGDFYDVFSLPGDRWGLVLADVSGKGAPAALYMTTVQTLLREHRNNFTSPGKTLEKINHLLLEYSSSDMFVTVFYAVLDPTSCMITYANAGHDFPLLRRSSGSVVELESTGPLLGVFGQEPIGDASVRLDPGDSMIAFTDGVVDARNERGQTFGIQRIRQAVHTNSNPTDSAGMLKSICDELRDFTHEEEQVDDITICIISKR
jgi:serine phosphatase RsbU (regulator of sigma subunit)